MEPPWAPPPPIVRMYDAVPPRCRLRNLLDKNKQKKTVDLGQKPDQKQEDAGIHGTALVVPMDVDHQPSKPQERVDSSSTNLPGEMPVVPQTLSNETLKVSDETRVSDETMKVSGETPMVSETQTLPGKLMVHPSNDEDLEEGELPPEDQNDVLKDEELPETPCTEEAGRPGTLPEEDMEEQRLPPQRMVQPSLKMVEPLLPPAALAKLMALPSEQARQEVLRYRGKLENEPSDEPTKKKRKRNSRKNKSRKKQNTGPDCSQQQQQQGRTSSRTPNSQFRAGQVQNQAFQRPQTGPESVRPYQRGPESIRPYERPQTGPESIRPYHRPGEPSPAKKPKTEPATEPKPTSQQPDLKEIAQIWAHIAAAGKKPELQGFEVKKAEEPEEKKPEPEVKKPESEVKKSKVKKPEPQIVEFRMKTREELMEEVKKDMIEENPFLNEGDVIEDDNIILQERVRTAVREQQEAFAAHQAEMNKPKEEPVPEEESEEKRHKKRVLTAERKKKKKENERKKRAENERRLGIRRRRPIVFTPIEKPKPICKYFLKGRCTKGEECTFSHEATPETKSELCKYFLTRCCLKGDECPFSHDTSKFPCKYLVVKGHCNDSDCKFSHRPVTPEEYEKVLKRFKKPEQRPENEAEVAEAEVEPVPPPQVEVAVYEPDFDPAAGSWWKHNPEAYNPPPEDCWWKVASAAVAEAEAQAQAAEAQGGREDEGVPNAGGLLVDELAFY